MDIKRILAIRNDRFGEFLLTMPAVRALKKKYPQARLSLVVDSYIRELASCIDCVDEVIVWDNRRHRFSQIIAFASQLRQKRFDMSIAFNPSKEANIICFLAAIPRRIGYAHKWDFLLNATIADTKHLAKKREVEYNLELAQLAGAATDDTSLLGLFNEQKLLAQNIDELLPTSKGQLIAIHPFTSDSSKQWPLERFQALASEVLNLPDTTAVIIGAKSGSEATLPVFEGSDKNLINVVGKTTLLQLASLLKRCRLLISGDSGPVHLAAAMGTPVIVLFRSDIAAKSARRWGPWGRNHTVIAKKSLLDISVSEVMAKINAALTEKNKTDG